MIMSAEPKPGPRRRISTEKFKAVMAQRDAALENLRSATARVSRISDPPADITRPYAAQRPKKTASASQHK